MKKTVPLTCTLWLCAAAATAMAACDGAPSNEAIAVSDLSSALCAAAPSWTAGASYRRGDLVQYGGKVYECVQSHTSLSVWTPDVVPALWSDTSCAPGGGAGGGGTTGATTGGTAGGSPGTAGGTTGSTTGGMPGSAGGTTGGPGSMCPSG